MRNTLSSGEIIDFVSCVVLKFYLTLKIGAMFNNGNGEMHMGSYSFMGIHVFWWFSIVVLGLALLVAAHKYRKRK